MGLVRCCSVARPPTNMAFSMLRAVIDVAAGMEVVSVVPVSAATSVPPVVTNINLSSGNSDGSNWWRASGESGALTWGTPLPIALSGGESGGNAWTRRARYFAPNADSSHAAGQRKTIEDEWKPEPEPWKPDKGQWEKSSEGAEDEYWEKYKEGEDPAAYKGRQRKRGARPFFVLPCRGFAEQTCRDGNDCKYSHIRLTSLSDNDYLQFIRLACPSANEQDIEFLWSLSKSDRLAVVNQGKLSNVDDIKACCEGRIKRAKYGPKRARFDPNYVPPPGGNQAAAATAAEVASVSVAGALPEAVGVAASRDVFRSSRQEGRTGVWRSGVADRWYSNKGFGFIRPDDGGADVFIHTSVLGDARDMHFDKGCAVRFVEVFDVRKQKTRVQTAVIVKERWASSPRENTRPRSRSRTKVSPQELRIGLFT